MASLTGLYKHWGAYGGPLSDKLQLLYLQMKSNPETIFALSQTKSSRVADHTDPDMEDNI